jgi:peroxiredoxin
MNAGQTAPDFTLPDQDGNSVTLSDLRGQPVVGTPSTSSCSPTRTTT